MRKAYELYFSTTHFEQISEQTTAFEFICAGVLEDVDLCKLFTKSRMPVAVHILQTEYGLEASWKQKEDWVDILWPQRIQTFRPMTILIQLPL